MKTRAARSGPLPEFEVTLADGPADLRAAQRLRYRVFVAELGGSGEMVDHAAGIEADRFDQWFDHLLLRDRALPGPPEAQVIGVYRLLPQGRAALAGQFYSEDEYDLAPLRASGRRLLEMGRSCIDARYRGGDALLHLWQGLARYVAEDGAEVLFGVASFRGTDPAALAAPLSLLHHRHLAPPGLRARSLQYQPMDLIPEETLDRRAAMLQVPPLIKAYLRLGGHVGDGAFIDRPFNTTDVCLILDTARLSAAHRAIYAPAGGA
ncbi:ornithine-acyl-ACP acyltransferase [Pelagivirga sediminicola]|uniref:L-ornithine N(alpha)-acyltransferase n=1 Tax=Pelagivirga sediminicola TaxID=2170575 RepID=A0A2T7G325_9RHOB|nr:GNAT family N-acyltransferase [Pelagivirga sediminicola]PVA08827.1 ornithine-acyl-ACP acyltransferase [Pelagivirga sediminicola]